MPSTATFVPRTSSGPAAATAWSASPIRSVRPRSDCRAWSRWRRRSSTSACTSASRAAAAAATRSRSRAASAASRSRSAAASRSSSAASCRALSRYAVGLGAQPAGLVVQLVGGHDRQLLDLVGLAQPGVGLGPRLGQDPLGLLRPRLASGPRPRPRPAAASPAPGRTPGTRRGRAGRRPAAGGRSRARPSSSPNRTSRWSTSRRSVRQLRLGPGRVVVDLEPVVAVHPGPEDRPVAQQLVEVAGEVGPGDRPLRPGASPPAVSVRRPMDPPPAHRPPPRPDSARPRPGGAASVTAS